MFVCIYNFKLQKNLKTATRSVTIPYVKVNVFAYWPFNDIECDTFYGRPLAGLRPRGKGRTYRGLSDFTIL